MSEIPHYVLISRIGFSSCPTPNLAGARGEHGSGSGSWHFILKSTTGTDRLEAGDTEDQVTTDRLELLAVVRGLEALEQPSRVTLMTASRLITRGIREGIEQWKADGWTWERFGVQVPVKNGDLWRRIDRSLQIHQVRCLRIRVDAAHLSTPRSGLSHRLSPSLPKAVSGPPPHCVAPVASGRQGPDRMNRSGHGESANPALRLARQNTRMLVPKSERSGPWLRRTTDKCMQRVAGWLHHFADNLAGTGQIHANL